MIDVVDLGARALLDLPPSRGDLAEDDFEKGRFPETVGPDDAEALDPLG